MTAKIITKKREDKFLKMRADIIVFVERERNKGLKTYDLVDCIICNWFMPYEKQAQLNINKYWKSRIQNELKAQEFYYKEQIDKILRRKRKCGTR